MKMKTLSLVLGAALGASAMQVSADALLAPYFKQGPGIITTNYLMKTRGQGIYNSVPWSSEHNVKTYFFYKYDSLPNIEPPTWGFAKQTEPCRRANANSKFSSFDYVVADVRTGTLYPFPDSDWQTNPTAYLGDKTQAPLFAINNTEGFIIFQEQTTTGVLTGVEGDFLGFVYIFSISAASAIDYKMLNNPTSQDGNDWSNTVISKNIFDVSWWPVGAVDTMWPTIVVGNNMLASYNDYWYGRVNLQRYEGWTGSLSSLIGQVYDNDERLWSSINEKPMVCAGQVTRGEFLDPNAALYTRNGGWTRLIGVVQANANGDVATGAVMQKWENFLPRGPLAWTIETSGNSAANTGWAAGLANTPY